MCLAPQRRAIFQQFFDMWTSKSGPYLSFFWVFELQMCFSLQRRANFPHPNFKKWSETVSFLTFWLQNVLLATAACKFSTSQLQKVARTCSEKRIFFQNVLLATAACKFSTSQLQKVARTPQFFDILTSKCGSRYSGVQIFWSPLNSDLRTRRFTEVTFRPSRPTNHCKTQHFATLLPFRACDLPTFRAFASSFLQHCFFNCPYCRKLDF